MPMLWNKDKLCEESEKESPQNRATICLVKTDTPPRLKIAFPHLNRRILSILCNKRKNCELHKQQRWRCKHFCKCKTW